MHAFNCQLTSLHLCCSLFFTLYFTVVLSDIFHKFKNVMNNLTKSLLSPSPFSLFSQDTLVCEHCGKNKVTVTRYSEGYGTEVICVCFFIFVCADLMFVVAFILAGSCGQLISHV